MDKVRLKTTAKLIAFLLVGTIYIVISNYDTFQISEPVYDLMRIISFIVSFVAGFFFFCSIFALPVLIYRLIARKRLGHLIIWTVFIGFIYIGDLKLTRFYFLDIEKDRAITKAETLIGAIDQYHYDHSRYPSKLHKLIPEYIDSIPKPSSNYLALFRYKNLDSTFTLSFNQWIGGRTYRSFSYSPTGAIEVPEFGYNIEIGRAHV